MMIVFMGLGTFLRFHGWERERDNGSNGKKTLQSLGDRSRKTSDDHEKPNSCEFGYYGGIAVLAGVMIRAHNPRFRTT
jgi:hypothetical protein